MGFQPKEQRTALLRIIKQFPVEVTYIFSLPAICAISTLILMKQYQLQILETQNFHKNIDSSKSVKNFIPGKSASSVKYYHVLSRNLRTIDK